MECPISSVQNCVERFDIKQINPLFRPLMNVILCYCNIYKYRLLKKTNSPNKTLLSNPYEISYGDYNFFRISHLMNMEFIQRLSPIIIKKYKTSETECVNKNYLSQLFEKTCILLYKPVFIKQLKDVDGLESSSRDNIFIGNQKSSALSGFNRWYFRLSIAKLKKNENGLFENDLDKYSNLPVYYILDDTQRLSADDFNGPAIQFYNSVLKELLDHKVFILSKTPFNNDRYELNMNFNIEKLDFYKNLPEEIKQIEGLKTKLTEYFYFYVGNLIHFAVANNLELPFKLSRIYIMQLFNLFDFTNIMHLDKNTELQFLLISTYLIEKVPNSLYNTIIEIFKNPSKLKDTKDDVIRYTLNNDENPNFERKGVHKNGLNNIVSDGKNVPIYNEKSETQTMNNMIEFLYKNAFKEYFENKYTDGHNHPINKSYKINENLKQFLNGFKFTKEFDETKMDKVETMKTDGLTFYQRLLMIRKLDIYLSGFGITYETIINNLIPQITFNDIYPLQKHEIDIHPFLTLSINDFDNVNDKHALLFYKVLLSRGENIPHIFISAYNERFGTDTLTNEEYHNEFIKYLLKFWSGAPNIANLKYNVFFNNDAPSMNFLTALTCFTQLSIYKNYTTVNELYTDIANTLIQTAFGETLLA
jgi:hypothetical protein